MRRVAGAVLAVVVKAALGLGCSHERAPVVQPGDPDEPGAGSGSD